MSSGPRLQRLTAGILLAAVVATAGGLHLHENLAGLIAPMSPGAPDRVVSHHSPLSKASHWHSIVRTDDHPCLACQSHRMAGLAAHASLELPVLIIEFAGDAVSSKPISIASFANGSRAPPSLL